VKQSRETTPEDPQMLWNGWGDPSRAAGLPLAVRALLPALLGRVQRPSAAPELSDVTVDASRLSPDQRSALEDIVGTGGVDVSREARLRHAGGRSTPDLLRRRLPEQRVPDAVVRPAGHDEVARLVREAASIGTAVVPFGGGTSVVGGLDPERGAHSAVIAVDLASLSGLIALDPLSAEATLGAGTRGPEAERLLAAHGFELGHYPQSFRYASIGGFAAARSSGQNSAGYGRFDAMVTGLRVATPTGELTLGRAPGSAAGPDLVRVFLGSEGAFGVITEVRVRVHPVPSERIVESWTFPDFATGVEALRRVVQGGAQPTVIRLSDEVETGVSLAQVGKIGRVLARGASAVTVFEGDGSEAKREHTAALLTAAGGTSAGRTAAQEWMDGRFDGPYLRDALLGAGVFCETLETATNWANLHHLRETVTSALREGFAAAGAKSFIMCHVSHVYPTGASLYFTVLAGVRGDQLAVWAPVKRRVGDAIMSSGGTITHHHAIGRDHAPWLVDEIGETGVRILRAIKRELDPSGVLNPGVLVADRD
jgi:alkyldihydroxyacetonephosphate synthase